MTAAKPGTALPWTLDEGGYIYGAGWKVNEPAVMRVRNRPDDAYIVAACNAYPQLVEDRRRLVETLREFVRIAGERDMKDVRVLTAGTEARDLLRDIGELE